MRKTQLILSLAISFAAVQAFAVDFSGTYSFDENGSTYTLMLQQTPQGKVVGTLVGPKSFNFKLDGDLDEDKVLGVCGNDQAAYFFVAGFQGAGQLLLMLVEPDENNKPDMDTAQTFTFTRVSVSSGGNSYNYQSLSGGKIQKPGPAMKGKPYAQIYGSAPPPPAPAPSAAGSARIATSSSIGPNEVGSSKWGFKFTLPYGWQHELSDDIEMLINSSVTGFILVFSHTYTSFDIVKKELKQGIDEEGVELTLVSQLYDIGNNAVGGIYSGTMNGQKVKARVIGTVSPFGGGAYIIAVDVPERFSPQLTDTADGIARDIQYFQPVR